MSEYEKLLKQFGLVEAQVGINEDGEPVVVTIDNECAEIRTIQKNSRFHRINIYWKDGTEEEMYE